MTPLLLRCPVCSADREHHSRSTGDLGLVEVWMFTCGGSVLSHKDAPLVQFNSCRNALQNKLTEMNNQEKENK